MSKLWPHVVRAVIFDNDGTLMNTEWVYSIAHKEVTGHDLEWSFKVKLMGKTPLEASRMTCEYRNLSESPESLCARRSAVENRYWGSVPLMPGALALVRGLSDRKIRQAIATASNRPSFELKSTANRELVCQMDHVVCGDEVAHGKPEPDLFLAALRKWEGIAPENALVFEDSPLGIAAANRAGMPAVFIPDPHVDPVESLKEYDAKAILTIESLEAFDFQLFEWESR
jgi:pseudouridine-5'-monophosphatase